MGKVASVFDHLEARAGYGCAIGAPICLGQDAIARAPQHQRWNANTVEAAFEFRIVHVRRPGVTRGRFSVAGGGMNLCVRHSLVVMSADVRIEIGKLDKLALGYRIDIDDVPRLAVTDLDADRVRKDEMR